MGKVIVIKDADFSGVAVEKIEYDNPARTEFAVIEKDGYYYTNPTSGAPVRSPFLGYGSLKIDVSTLIGRKIVVSGAVGTTSYIIRIDDVEDNRLYYKPGNGETNVKDEVIIPVGAKWVYLNNYFTWDTSPFSYIYEQG